MPRSNPEPWFRTERKGYFVTINGVQHNLHTPDKAEAFRRWHELMVRAVEPAESPHATVVVGVVSSDALRQLKVRRAATITQLASACGWPAAE